MDKKNESSIAPNIKGAQGPMSKKVFRRMESDQFEDLVNKCVLNDQEIEEVVKKRGDNWVVFDDKTGVEKGSYPTRADAWKKQRQFRQTAKQNKPKSKTKKAKPKPKVGHKAQAAPKAKVAPKAQLAAKPDVQKEGLLNLFKQQLHKVLVKEGSALSYVFEQSPLDNDSAEWENFLQKLSKQALVSDERLKNILRNVAKAEMKILSNSVNAIKEILESTGTFEVIQGKPNQDSEGNVFLSFVVSFVEFNKKLPFAVKVENGRPLIHFPDQTRAELNSMNSEESKLLRAELMHIQETVLDKVEDLTVATEKRDAYLKSMESQIDRILKNMDALQVSMLRHVLKQKYKGVK